MSLVTIPLCLLQPSRIRKVGKSKQVSEYVQVLREREERAHSPPRGVVRFAHDVSLVAKLASDIHGDGDVLLTYVEKDAVR